MSRGSGFGVWGSLRLGMGGRVAVSVSVVRPDGLQWIHLRPRREPGSSSRKRHRSKQHAAAAKILGSVALTP